MDQEPFDGATYHIIHLLTRIDMGVTALNSKEKPEKPPVWAQDRFWLAVLGAAFLLLAPAEKQVSLLKLFMN